MTALRLEGYAALFGVADLQGDVVHAGAFQASLARNAVLPMLVRHDPRLPAGVWTHLREDARGLRVEGVVEPSAQAGALAARLVARGVDGLSIGFRAVTQRPRHGGGRDLLTIDLIEISIVPTPMVPHARLSRAAISGSERMLHA